MLMDYLVSKSFLPTSLSHSFLCKVFISLPMMLILVSSLMVKDESCWTVSVTPFEDMNTKGSGTICKV